MIAIDFAATKLFVDRAAVKRRTSRAHRRFLARAGGYARKTARRSMRPAGKKGKRSQPGEPPRSREGSLRRFLYFQFEPGANSVIVGPAGFSGSRVPDILERGGTLAFTDKRTKQKRTKRIAARPYMAPALAATAPQLETMMADAYRREFDR